MIHVRETAPFYFSFFWSPPCDDCSPPAWGVFFESISVFYHAAAFFSKNTVDDSLWFCCFWTPNTPKFSRRASRAGLLHFPIVLLVLDAKYPKNFPARFARRMASFPYGFACFGTQIPQNSPGALRAPDCLRESLRGSLRDCLGTQSGNS